MYSFSDKTQKIALIGSGYWGTILLNSLHKLNFKNILVHDKNQNNISILKKKFKQITILNNFNEILLDDKIKNIFVATPPSENYEIIKKIFF